MPNWKAESMLQYLEQHKDDAKVIGRALAVMYTRQTAAEQEREATICRNGVGFTAFDARYLSSLAKFYTQRGFLTAKQCQLAYRSLRKYAGQLAEAANQRGSSPPPAPIQMEMFGGQQ